MTNPASALDAVMNQAEAAAGAIAPVSLPIPANTNVAGPVALAKPSLDSFADGGGMDVDEYLKVKAEGFKIGDEMGLIEELEVEIDMSEVTPIYSFRCELGGQTKFVKSYDGVTTSDGKSFQGEVDRLTRVGEKPSGVYETIEIPMTLLNDVSDTKKKVTFDADTRIGYTPSITAAKPFRSFTRKLRQANPALLQDVVKVKLTHEKRTKGQYEWGIVNFELIEG